MDKKLCGFKFWLVMGLSLIFALPGVNAFAADRGKDRGRDGHRGGEHEVVVVGHDRYHYRDGRFYRLSWFGFEFILSASPIGAIVMAIPSGHKTTVSGGTTYYYYNNVYYRSHGSGYVVVPAPAANPHAETVTVNVPNSNGSYTPVTLVKYNNGYIGPQGEYYSGNPSVSQLRALYGR